MDCLLINKDSPVFLQNQHVTQNRLSFAGSQTLLASENEFNSTGNFNSTETVGDACRLPRNWFQFADDAIAISATEYEINLLLILSQGGVIGLR